MSACLFLQAADPLLQARAQSVMPLDQLRANARRMVELNADEQLPPGVCVAVCVWLCGGVLGVLMLVRCTTAST